MSCLKCGICCLAIPLKQSPWELFQMDSDDAKFVTENWTPISKVEAGMLNPDMVGSFVNGEHFFSCDRLDRRTMKCTIYRKRPKVCWGYPWYGEKPGTNRALIYPKGCGYRRRR